ncbi:MAG: nucleotidyltransferase domain-containing protein [Bacteroidetes bacterium]|nr:nucleotidyltransferase domain-containing protein [Bacteroidota bacterium]
MKLELEKMIALQNYFKDKPVVKAYLFGSYVRGQATKNSDIDILLELDYNQRIGLGFVQMKLDLEEILRKDVDLVTSGSLSNYIMPEIDKEKQLIYARQ